MSQDHESAFEIRRIEVEEGFLDGLNLEFSSGLNVLIGPRGSGKTSVLELIRYCLGAESVTERFGKIAREHALGILGSGRVTVTLEYAGRHIQVSRSQEDPGPRAGGYYPKPLVFSQSEIENVGLEAQGRLRILDGFLSTVPSVDTHVAEKDLETEIRSITAEITDVCNHIEVELERVSLLEPAREALDEAVATQASLLATVTAADAERASLATLGERIAEISVRYEVFERASGSLSSWIREYEHVLRRVPVLPVWLNAAGNEDALLPLRTRLEARNDALREMLQDYREILEEIERLVAATGLERTELENNARQLRRSLEELQEGAGSAALKVSELRSQVAQLDATHSRLQQLRDRFDALQHSRANLLNLLESKRHARFERRKAAAARVNAELGPSIEIRVESGGQDEDYANAVREGLKGSGLRYNALAPLIADRMTPRELVEAVEKGDADHISNVLELPVHRTQRIAAELRSTDLGRLLTIPVQDTVTMMLLDGRDYKSTLELSTGQRCTVVLSALLAQQGPPLLVDQPEDHLDNAFVVETLVESILRTKQRRQLIFSTHNPNIPVLGEAEQVVLLGSDGRRAFVRHANEVDHPESVQAITSVMEGGARAFARRAEFYDLRRRMHI